jgi:prevent-host-death family protein
LSAVVEAARRGGPLFVTKRGVPAVVVLAAGMRAAERLYLSVVDHR